MRDLQIALADGREIAYVEMGERSGPCVFFFHGAPISRLHLVPLADAFAASGLRVVAPDRPGYGRSSPRPGRSFADWPADVAALADALHIDRFLVAGHSSGGVYAVVCAAELRDRVIGAAVIGGVTDMSWPDAWTGYLEGRVETELMRLRDEAAILERCVDRFGADGSRFLAEPFTFPEPDLALLADEAYERSLSSAVVEAFRQGVVGYAQDLFLEGRGWSFDAARASAPVEVLHGESDTLVPIAHSRHTAALIPSATFRTLAGHGHLSILSELPTTMAALLPAAR